MQIYLKNCAIDLKKNNLYHRNCESFSGDPEYLPIDEQHPTGKCTNPYGKTKFFMEEIIKDQCAANPVSKCNEICYGFMKLPFLTNFLVDM